MLLNEVDDDEMIEIYICIDIHDTNNYEFYGRNFVIRKYDKVYDRYNKKFYKYDDLFRLNFFKYKYISFFLCPFTLYSLHLFPNLKKDIKERVEKNIFELVMHFCCDPDKIIIFNNIGDNKKLISELDVLINPCNKVYYNPIIKYKKNKIIIKSNN